jgi:hypothetical protein
VSVYVNFDAAFCDDGMQRYSKKCSKSDMVRLFLAKTGMSLSFLFLFSKWTWASRSPHPCRSPNSNKNAHLHLVGTV